MLAVIGAGWCRTGTYTLATALTLLGYGPCQHMVDVAADPDLARRWRRRLDGEGTWDDVYTGYRSAVDWPTSTVAAEVAQAHPDARVVLTARPAADWYRSFHRTVLADGQDTGADPELTEVVGRAARRALGPHGADEDGWTRAYAAHHARLVASVDPGRLLVWSVREGWGPLCRFLDRRPPRLPFPRTNDTAFFLRHAPPPR
ncbi:sulfotransferase family protein [Micromonospora endolithica]|uniref:Sulfotransferase family protein n=1 Tax=Micromonospora endolithica TaxID=230091 RepID=A0A3A9ZJ68_9ACTN|nr:sulfotransferase family protein [Micromonospora endolithica]RKN47814.1 sulfotransferase family protein [Micromonospora endolithica]TWJ21497.1 hypothetical protein JD76_01607 [Micromonospora endolithica]